jgi:septal ring factor EnvC (AmiA/AmiB activator)
MPAGFCLLALFCLVSQAHAGKTETSKEALSQLQSRIESLTKDLNNKEQAHAEAADALKQSEQSISETNRKLFDLGQQQKSNRDTLQSLQQEKNGLSKTIARQQQLLNQQLTTQYIQGQQSYTQIILSQQDPNDIARQLHYFSYVARARADLISNMRKNLNRVATLNDQTATALKQIDDLKAQQESQRKQLESEKADRKNVLSQLSTQIQAQRGEISKLKRDEKRLSDLVERLARIVPPTPKPQKPSKTQKPRQETTESKNDDVPTPAFSGSGFGALKGKLRLPVRGTVSNRFGAPREESGISWKGLFIKASEGEEVKAIADGRVVFADWLRGFGNLMIVDHGNGYMSLYGNNQALLRKVGDSVNAGDSIASVGNSGGNDASGLYFELRYQSKPFDPLSWCVVK